MPESLEWLQEPLAGTSTTPSLVVFTIRLALSFLFGCLVAGIYALNQHKPRAELVPFVSTLLLLTILIAMVTLVIGNSVARAFGLVGALSIVRFRTVVEDTRDTAFVIFAVVVGMGVGAGYALVTLVGIPIVALATFLLGLWGRTTVSPTVSEFSLSIRLGIGRDPEILLRELFAKHLAAVHLRSTSTARQGVALDLSYRVRLRREEDAVAFVSALNQVEGVQNVELQRL